MVSPHFIDVKMQTMKRLSRCQRHGAGAGFNAEEDNDKAFLPACLEIARRFHNQ